MVSLTLSRVIIFALFSSTPLFLMRARVKITDSAGSERFAPLYFVSPNRITLLISPRTSPGFALITVTNGGNVVAQGAASIATTAPGLLSADLSGRGYAAARLPDSRRWQPGLPACRTVRFRTKQLHPGPDRCE
ncbi:MAG: hypothetical protein L0220_24075 [Acidobacteria bacterium]|nr:hypothetical protein [Acidobacteriota bacterium]